MPFFSTNVNTDMEGAATVDPHRAAQVIVDSPHVQGAIDGVGGLMQGGKSATEAVGNLANGGAKVAGALAEGGTKLAQATATSTMVGSGVSAAKTVWDGVTSWLSDRDEKEKAEAAVQQAQVYEYNQNVKNHQATAPARIRQRDEAADRESTKAARRAFSELRPFRDEIYVHSARPKESSKSPGDSQGEASVGDEVPAGDVEEGKAAGKGESQRPTAVNQPGDDTAPEVDEAQVAFSIVYVTHSSSLRLKLEEDVSRWDEANDFHPRQCVFERLEDALAYLDVLLVLAQQHRQTATQNRLHHRPTPAPRTCRDQRTFFPVNGQDIARLAAAYRRQYRIILCDPTNGVDALETPREHIVSGISDRLLNDDPLVPSPIVIVGDSEDDKPRHAIRFYNRITTTVDKNGTVTKGDGDCKSLIKIPEWAKGGVFREVALRCLIGNGGEGFYRCWSDGRVMQGDVEKKLYDPIRYKPLKPPAQVDSPPVANKK